MLLGIIYQLISWFQPLFWGINKLKQLIYAAFYTITKEVFIWTHGDILKMVTGVKK